MPRYRKKPVVIEAEQYLGNRYVTGMCESSSCTLWNNPHVHTIHNNQAVILKPGDWVIPEPDGEHFYPCKPDIFAETYELVTT